MGKEGFVHADTDVIRAKLNAVNMKTSTTASTYSGDEFETSAYINNLFQNGIDAVDGLWKEICKVEDQYLEKLVIFPDPKGITTGNVNFREGPSTNTKSYGTLTSDTEVEIIEDNGDGWVHIKYNDNEGYISKKYLEIEDMGELL